MTSPYSSPTTNVLLQETTEIVVNNAFKGDWFYRMEKTQLYNYITISKRYSKLLLLIKRFSLMASYTTKLLRWASVPF